MRNAILASVSAIAAVGIMALTRTVEHCYLIGWSEICVPVQAGPF